MSNTTKQSTFIQGDHEMYDIDEWWDVEVTYEDGSTQIISVPFSPNDIGGAIEGGDDETKEEISKYLSQFSKPESDKGCLIDWTATFIDP